MRTRRERLRSPRGIASALVLAVAGCALGWLCLDTTAVEILPPGAVPGVLRSDHPEQVLTQATRALVAQRGRLSPDTLAAVRRAAAAAPLDARPYLILGHQYLLEGQADRALATLEAGQRLDPRQKLIHILLLDRYLRTGRYDAAATQFSLMARLMGATQGPIAAAMAQMSVAPETRDAVRRTLASDPVLEGSVLLAMARSDIAPSTIFALASPAALADAGDTGAWGPALVKRLVEKGNFAAARSVWTRIYRLPDAAARAPIFNIGFARSHASPPFNWTLAAGSIGAADMRSGAIAIDYYGRDSGELANQLLVLAPGRYRFTVTVDPGKTDTASRLLWTLTCAGGAKTPLMRLPVTAAATQRRLAADVTVPTGCPAQTLQLIGEAGDFPAPIAVSLRNPAITPISGSQP